MSRYDHLASLRAERHEEQRDHLLTERVACEQRYRDAQQRASDLVALGDIESAKWYDVNLEEIEREVAQIDAQLDAFDRAQMPADGLFNTEREYIQQNPDIANQPGVEKVAAYYSNYLEGLGYQRGTQEHLEGMKVVLEPQNYEPPLTADRVVELLNTESKYGKDLTADEYNANVAKLWRLKRAGEYPDR